MIDTHCHLEQQDYQKDRDQIIESCKKELKAVITCCAHPKDFDLTMKICDQHKGFLFPTVSIHPEFVKEITEKQKEDLFDLIRKNKDRIVGIGESGLEYFWTQENEFREKQKDLFRDHIRLAKELDKPIIIHSREAGEDTIRIMEEEGAKRVQMHMFSYPELLKRVIDNGWFISLNTLILRSKKHKKIVRDAPLERIFTETDAPWLGPEGKRNTPLSVKHVIERIAEIKKLDFGTADKQTTENALKFFGLD